MPRLCGAPHNRGVYPSCNARRMVETAAHSVDQVFAPLRLRPPAVGPGGQARVSLRFVFAIRIRDDGYDPRGSFAQ